MSGSEANNNDIRIFQLYISGGSFRCATAASGVVAYLAHTGRWGSDDKYRGVRQVASVSGGSLLNGALLAGATSSGEDDPSEAIETFLKRLVADKGSPFATWARRGALLGFVALLGSAVSILLIALGVFGPDVPSVVRVGAGLAFVPWCLMAFRAYFAANTKDLARSLVGASVETTQSERHREHIICAAGLSTGEPLLFYWPMNKAMDRVPDVKPLWGQVIPGIDAGVTGDHAFDVIRAVGASSALPGAASMKVNLPGVGKQLVGDGGVVGTFGDLATLGKATTSQTLAIDGSRHIGTESGLMRRVFRLSFLYATMRWLNVAFEATYRNDIVDIPQKIRVAREIENPSTPFEYRLNVLRRQTANMGLFGFNLAKAGASVANGVLSAAYEFGEIGANAETVEQDAEQLLRDVGCKIGFEDALVAAWQATARSLFFDLQPVPRAMSHHGLPVDGEAPSIIGYSHAREAGYRCMQADLMRSTDGELVVAHSVFGRHLPFTKPTSGAPTLRSVIDDALEPGTFWNLETKSNQTLDLLRDFLRVEESAGRLRHYCVSAPMRSGLLRELRFTFPELATNDSLIEGALFGRPASPRSRTRKATASGCQLWYWQVRLWPSLSAARARGRRVQVWGVSTKHRADWLHTRGVPMVISNGSNLGTWPASDSQMQGEAQNGK